MMNKHEAQIYLRKLAIEAELKELEEIFSLFTNVTHSVSYEKKIFLEKKIREFNEFKLTPVKSFEKPFLFYN